MEDFAIKSIAIVITDTRGKYIKTVRAKQLKDETIHAIMEDIGEE